MKTLLTIEGTSYLVNNPKNLATILDLFRDLVPIRSETAYGPIGTDKEFDKEFYRRADVTQASDASVKVELVRDDQVLSPAKWAQVCVEVEEKNRAYVEAHPKATETVALPGRAA